MLKPIGVENYIHTSFTAYVPSCYNMPTLRADVYVSSELDVAVERGGKRSKWSPISCTLIQGDAEVVLVDTPISIEQTEDLVEWIRRVAPAKKLSYIYITHGHPDHWFGIPIIQKHFPEAKPVATPRCVEHMQRNAKPEYIEGLWEKFFPNGQIAKPFVFAEPLASPSFYVEGHEFRTQEAGHSDTRDSTFLWVPDLRLVVAGDIVYGDVHQQFAEANTPEKRREWLAALDAIEALEPHLVVAGHKRAGTLDGVFNVSTTRDYIHTFNREAELATNWKDLWQRMIELYPSRVNIYAAMAGSMAAFGENAYGINL